MHIWAVSNQKGGVGKTTSTVALGGLLAARGERVLLIDLDPHGSLTSYFRHDPDTVRQSVYHLFFNQQWKDTQFVRGLLRTTSMDNVQVLPSSTSLAALESKVSAQEGMGLVLSSTLSRLWDDYDYALIDTPPILGVLLINALAACQQLVIPTQTEHLALKGLDRMVHTLKMVLRSQQRQLPYRIVPTLFDRRTNASLMALKDMRRAHGSALWDEVIPVDTRLRDASYDGVFPHQLDPESRGIRAYRHLLATLEQTESVSG